MNTIDEIIARPRRRELAHRRTCGIDVRLIWDPAGDDLTVEVRDGDAAALLVPVGGRPPLDVFRHPYAYAVA
jgi:hypothetical protein